MNVSDPHVAPTHDAEGAIVIIDAMVAVPDPIQRGSKARLASVIAIDIKQAP